MTLNARVHLRSPRLAPSIAPLRTNPRGNILEWAAAEFAEEGRRRGLTGEKLQEFLKERMTSADCAVTELHKGLRK